ncbi:YraN family protein [Endozoicomonas sp. OPT23]|uniref:YraN family protein n=1 Tax=Endozoicomonas sp. OPT23 TaxID=2072845 RepID=UPI00129B57C4|nr:YraN family protein [Endozoicomonas sp. OPT23]MRI35391.1 YraN family protein [Endozoicomonas sp. OPT23]
MFWTLKQKTNSKGAQAEKLALNFLQSQSLQLVTKNYACRNGELDLIMLDGESLVFIEVRLRTNSEFGGASGSITAPKQRRLEKTALHFLQSHPAFSHRFCRFDLVCLTSAQSNNDEHHQKPIEWLKGVFQ